MSQKSVLIYHHPLEAALRARLERDYAVADLSYLADPTDNTAFRQALCSANGLIGSSVPMGGELLEIATQLQVISSISAGVDNFDIDYLNARGILLCHTPNVLTETTADTAFLLILAAARRAVELAELIKQGRWDASIAQAHYGVDVHGKRLGMVGMGRIGTAIARRARLGFNMGITYHNRSRRPAVEAELGAEWQSLEDLLRSSDIVCVTVPLSSTTRAMFGAREFNLMRESAIFVNISRGAVVDEPALIQALEAKTIRAAGLDVFAKEPLPPDSPLAHMDNVVALPHIGSATFETRYAMAELAVDNLLSALRGERPPAAYNWAQIKRD